MILTEEEKDLLTKAGYKAFVSGMGVLYVFKNIGPPHKGWVDGWEKVEHKKDIEHILTPSVRL